MSTLASSRGCGSWQFVSPIRQDLVGQTALGQAETATADGAGDAILPDPPAGCLGLGSKPLLDARSCPGRQLVAGNVPMEFLQ